MLPLSPPQEIVWFHEQLFPGGHAYHFTAVIDLRGKLDTSALHTSLAQLLMRHPGLCLALVDKPGWPAAQQVQASCELRYDTVDLTGEAAEGGRYQDILREWASVPFDLCAAPLVRWILIELAPEHHQLLHVEHHLIHDGRSFGIVLRDLFTLYRANVTGVTSSLPVTWSYEEYLTLLASRSQESRRSGVDYWVNALHGASTSLALPGLARHAARGLRGAQLRRNIDPHMAARLREVSKLQGHTPFITLLGLYAELLRRHSTDQDLVIGTAVDTRPKGFEESVGMFINTIPIRLNAAPTKPACEALDDIAEHVIRGLKYADAPIQEVTRGLRRYSADLRNPLFRTMFSAHDAPLPDFEVPELEVSLLEGLSTGTSRFDFDVVLLPDDRRTIGPKSEMAGMTLVWEYNTDLLDHASVDALNDRLHALLHNYLAQPTTPLAELSAAVQGTATLDVAVRDTGCPNRDGADPTVELVDLVRAVAAADPQRPALITKLNTLDYATLWERVDRLASILRDWGVSEGHFVACILSRGVSWVVALVACLRLGAVACPLSADEPVRRRAVVLHRLRPAVVLTTEGTEVPAALPRITLTEGTAAAPAGTAKVAEQARKLLGAAYVIHTSGSTGEPKAVVVGRQALTHYLTAITDRYALTHQDRALAFAQPWFDVSLEEILPTLHTGAALVVPRRDLPTARDLIALAAARDVSVANLPTSYFLAVRQELIAAFRQRRWSPRLLVLGGERLRAQAVCEAAEVLEGTVLNAYGITEAVVTSTVHEVGPQDLDRGHGEIPLGRPLAGVAIHIVDAWRRPLPPGMIGEIAISGPTLADGYLDAPEHQGARFVHLAGTQNDPVAIYLTGDLGFIGLDGELGFQGRRDNQVKLRGHRIELEEIEVAARAILGDVPCAVVHDGDGPLAPRLVGFHHGTGLSSDQISALLAERLPASLVPALWVSLDALPTLPGGKPDRLALARMAHRITPVAPDSQAAAVPFSSDGHPVRSILQKAWQEILGHDAFGENSHFFRVGGHSLLVIHLVSWLEMHCGARPPLRIVFEHPVLSDLADQLGSWLGEHQVQPVYPPQAAPLEYPRHTRRDP